MITESNQNVSRYGDENARLMWCAFRSRRRNGRGRGRSVLGEDDFEFEEYMSICGVMATKRIFFFFFVRKINCTKMLVQVK